MNFIITIITTIINKYIIIIIIKIIIIIMIIKYIININNTYYNKNTIVNAYLRFDNLSNVFQNDT